MTGRVFNLIFSYSARKSLGASLGARLGAHLGGGGVSEGYVVIDGSCTIWLVTWIPETVT